METKNMPQVNTTKADNSSESPKKYVHSIKLRIAFMLTVAPAILSICMVLISLNLYEKSSRNDHINIAKGVAKMASEAIKADYVEQYLTEGKNAPYYKETESQLYIIRANSLDIEYIYVYKILQDGCHVVFDLESEGTPAASPGEIIGFDPSFEPYLDKLLAGEQIDPVESNDTYGWLLTVYEPVYNSDGKCACYVGVDISMESMSAYKTKFIKNILILYSLIFIIILTIGLWIANTYLSKPINSIASYAGDFTATNGDLNAMNACVKKIQELNIKTGDEVENLYHSFSKMTEDTVSHIKNIQTQAHTISKMQDERIDMIVQHTVELEHKIEERTHALKLEKEKSQSLLLNILPPAVAQELTEHPDRTIAHKIPNVTVLFTDIVGFTQMSDQMEPEEVVTILNNIISKFDERARIEGISKIKTIGDAYMAATGMSGAPSENNEIKMIQFAQGMIKDVEEFNETNEANDIKLQIRLGINTGDLVAGVIGKSKFIYDVWGDTVNVASRMETTGLPMKIHVTEETYKRTKDTFQYSEGVRIEIKGKGMMNTYFL